MKKVIILLIAMLAVTGMVFAQAATETAPQEARPEVVGIKIWYSISGANGEFFKSQVEAFLAEHPEIKAEEITYSGSYNDSATKISAARLAGERSAGLKQYGNDHFHYTMYCSRQPQKHQEALRVAAPIQVAIAQACEMYGLTYRLRLC